MTVPPIPLALADSLDLKAALWRLGLVALATDQTSERDFMAMRPSQDLAVYVNRVAFVNPTSVENLLAMRPLLTRAAELILPGEPLDAIAYGCTAASALIGDAAVRDAIELAKPNVPVVTPTSAAFDAFRALSANRISILTPYSTTVTEALVSYLLEGGMCVLNASCLGLTDDGEIARVPPGSIVAAAKRTLHPDAETLFISCTALRAVSVAQEIEDQLGIPVITSNQALFWQTMRRAGCTLQVPGFGRLLELH